jgi:hypothetical protein
LLIHAEIGTAMLDKHVPLFERARIEQQLDPFAGGELAFGMLRVDAPLSPAEFGGRALLFELTDDR